MTGISDGSDSARSRGSWHVASGMSAKEFAIRLSIALCTVERHVENVRLKTWTRSRVHMVAYVLQEGLLQWVANEHLMNEWLEGKERGSEDAGIQRRMLRRA